MDPETQKLISEQFGRLPTDIQQAITSSNYKQRLNELFRKYQLHVDQGGALETETSLVMLGLSHPNDFVKNLKENLGIDDIKANAITRDVNNLIFLPIRASLMKIQEQNEKEEPEPAKTLPEQNLGKQVNTKVLPNKNPNESFKPFQRPVISSAPVPPPPVQKNAPQQTNFTPKPVTSNPSPNIVMQKTTSIVKIPTQEITLKETPKNTPFLNPIKKQYTVDPYREPLK